jgi:hypothetical protein
LIPIYLTRAASESPSVAGWLMAPLGLGMMCTYPWLGKLTQRCGIRETSTGGATVAFLGTLPFLYLSSHPLNLLILAGTLFIRGVGMSAVGIPSISAAYGSVRKEQLPMVTASCQPRKVAQRVVSVGPPKRYTMFKDVVHSPANVTNSFTLSFALLCSLHALLIVAAMRLPLSLKKIQHPPAEELGEAPTPQPGSG